jgi:outer membrane protein assembly factor BamD (BamD/ComL family)
MRITWTRILSGGALTVAALAGLALLAGCAGEMVTFEQKLLLEADSLFHAGNYEYAKVRYTKLRTEYPNTKSGARAQYDLAYLNIYFDNPYANPEAALKEFKAFATQYPDNELVPEVNSWIRLLVVVQSFRRQYDISSSEVDALEKELKAKRNEAGAPQKIGARYETLMEAVQRCYVEKDSLASRIRILEDVIDKIGKNP